MPSFPSLPSSVSSKFETSSISKSGDSTFTTLPNYTNKQWWKDPGLRRLNFGVFLMFSSAAANGFDCSLINGLQAIPDFHTNLGNIDKNILGLVIAGISLGALPSFIPGSYVSDCIGRRICVGLGSTIMVISSVVQSLSPGPWAFLATRVALGVGLGFAQTAAPPLATEIAHPRHRAQVVSLFQTVWYWGSVLSAAATLGCLYIHNSWSWRMPCLLQLVFPAIQIIGLFFVPESPRWLVSKGRKDEALAILAKYHANGDMDDELVRFEFDEIVECLAREEKSSKEGKGGFAAFFDTRGNIHRLAILAIVGVFTQWLGNGLFSYYLAPILESLGITNNVTKSCINLGLQVWNAMLAAAGAMAAERIGRRPLWLTSAIGMFFSLIVILALSAVFDKSQALAVGGIVVAMFFVFFGFYDIAFTPLSISYPVEILPYHLRSKGFSLNLTITFASSFFNQYVNPIALEKLGWKFYGVHVFLVAVAIILIYCVFPETKGRTLEEISCIFDGCKEPVALQEVRYVSATARAVVKTVGGRYTSYC